MAARNPSASQNAYDDENPYSDLFAEDTDESADLFADPGADPSGAPSNDPYADPYAGLSDDIFYTDANSGGELLGGSFEDRTLRRPTRDTTATPIAEDAFRPSVPGTTLDMPTSEPTRTPIAEDAFRPRPARRMQYQPIGTSVPGTTLGYASASPEPLSESEPEQLAEARSAEQAKPAGHDVSSSDHKANFRQLIGLNADLFPYLQDDVFDPRNPEARTQFNQAFLYSKVGALPGGLDQFEKAPAPVRRAFIARAVDQRLGELYPAIRDNPALIATKQGKQLRDAIQRDMVSGLSLATSVQGLRARRQQILGGTAFDTISNVLHAPDLDRETLDAMEPKDRAKLINAWITANEPNAQARKKLKLHLFPLLVDEFGDNWKKYSSDVFATRDAEGHPLPSNEADAKDQKQGYVASVAASVAQTAREWVADPALYIGGEMANFGGYLLSGTGAGLRWLTTDSSNDANRGQVAATRGGLPVKAKTTDQIAEAISEPAPVSDWIAGLGESWVEWVNEKRDAVTTQSAIDRRQQLSAAQSAAIEKGGTDGALEGLKSFASAMWESPMTAGEQVLGMIGGSLASGSVGYGASVATAKGLAKVSGKASARATVSASSKLAGVASAQAATAAGQTEQSVYSALHPSAGTPEYNVKLEEFRRSDLSQSLERQAKDAGLDYDAGEAFGNWARRAASNAAVIAGLVEAANIWAPGSVERILSGTASAARGAATRSAAREVSAQAAKSFLVEGATEAVQGIAEQTTQNYFQLVRDDLKKTGDYEAYVAALRDGRVAVQAAVGMILGGAVGAGFGALHGLSKGNLPKAVDADGQPLLALPAPQDGAPRTYAGSGDTISLPRDRETPFAGRDPRQAMTAEEALRAQAAAAMLPAETLALPAPQDGAPRRYIGSGETISLPPEIDAPYAGTDPRRPPTLEDQLRAAGEAERQRRATALVPVSTIYAGESPDWAARRPRPGDIDAPYAGTDPRRPPTLEDQISATAAQAAQSPEGALRGPSAGRAEQIAGEQAAPLSDALTLQEQVLSDISRTQGYVAIPRTPSTGGRLAFDPIEGGVAGPEGTYRVIPAAYAKGKVVVQAPGHQGLKTRAARLAQAVGGRYVNRANGYVMSPAQAERFQALYKSGHDADAVKMFLQGRKGAIEPPSPGTARSDDTGAGGDQGSNRQAGLAQTPLVESKAQQIIAAFGREIASVEVETGVSVPIDIVTLTDDEQARDYIEENDGANGLPGNTSFSTFAYMHAEKGEAAYPVILVNLSRIEASEDTKLVSELRAAAAVQFVLPKLTRDNARLRTAIDNFVRSAAKTVEGRDAAALVSAAYAGNDVPITDPHVFNLSFIKELMRNAPREIGPDGKPRFVLTRGTGQKFAVDLANFIRKWFGGLAKFLKIGVEGDYASTQTLMSLLSQLPMTDGRGNLLTEIDGDWTELYTIGELSNQRREYINVRRYSGKLAGLLQALRDRHALETAIAFAVQRVERADSDIPGTLGNRNQILTRLQDALDAVQLRSARTDLRLRNEVMPTIDRMKSALRDGANSAGLEVRNFTAQFDYYVQLLSAQEMLSPGGDFYKAHVQLSDEAEKSFDARMEELSNALEGESTTAARRALGKAASDDIDKLIAADVAAQTALGKPPAELRYGGLSLADVAAELRSIERNTPKLWDALRQAYGPFRGVMDLVTALREESGEYDPADIAFRNRKHFAFRGGQIVDASKLDKLVEGTELRADYSTGAIATPSGTQSAKGREALPKNATVEAMRQAVAAMEELQVSEVVKHIAYAAQIDPRLGKLATFKEDVDGEKVTRTAHPRSELVAKDRGARFDFVYRGRAKSGASKSASFVDDGGRVATFTFAHDDVAAGVKTQGIQGRWLRRFAHLSGYLGSLMTTRNPAFVVATQLPRDAAHMALIIVRRRHGGKAAKDFLAASARLLPSVLRYSALRPENRNAYLAKLPVTHPLRRYAASGVWLSGHQQHGLSDIITDTSRDRWVDKLLDSAVWQKASHSRVGNAIAEDAFFVRSATAGSASYLFNGGLAEAGDNLFRLAYFDVATREGTKGRLTDQTAAAKALGTMDFTSGSQWQRKLTPFFPFARAAMAGLYNVLARDAFDNGQLGLQETATRLGVEQRVADRAEHRRQMLAATGPLMLLGFFAYAARGMLAGDEPEKITPEEAMKGVFIGSNTVWPSQLGLMKLSVGLGALVAGVMNEDFSIKEAVRAYGNAITRETPGGLTGVQHVPSNEHSSTIQTMVAQIMGASSVGKPVQYLLNTNAFGREIHSPGGKLTTPSAYKEVARHTDYETGGRISFDPELVPYTLQQLGIYGAIANYIAVSASKNQTADEVARARGKLTGYNAVTVGGHAGKVSRRELEEQRYIWPYARQLRAARSLGPAYVTELRKTYPNARVVEGYMKLDAKLRQDYANARKTWQGRADYSQRIGELESRQAALRERALARLRGDSDN